MDHPFPLPYVLIVVGYLLVLTIDRVIVGWLLKVTGKEKEGEIGHSHGGEGHDHGDDHDHKHDEEHGNKHHHDKV